MRGRFGKFAMIGLVLTTLAGCGGSDAPVLLNLSSSNTGPDEFGILPTKPLQAPESFAELPQPTPGGSNLTDPTPKADAYAALGGNAAALNGPAQDSALIAHTTRHGVRSGIRSELAAADLEFRRRNDGRLLERLFNVNTYFKAYRPLSLDQYRELERFRASGIRTPAVPPDPAR